MINTNVTTEMYNKNKFDTYYEMPYMTYHIVRINPDNGVSQFYDTATCDWVDGTNGLLPWFGFSDIMEALIELQEQLNPDHIITLFIVSE